MVSQQIKDKFYSFLESYKLPHTRIPNYSLIPVNDPSVLFTTAGMHPLSYYLLGNPHPKGKRLHNIQRCFRTVELDEDSVGDGTHHTFFEMLGYWSLNDYFKEESLDITMNFFCSQDHGLGFDPKRLYVTVFKGDNDSPKDSESIKKWRKLFSSYGVNAEVFDGKNFNQNSRIFPLTKDENWWGPVGQTGPCGPDSEVFYWRGEGEPDFTKYTPWNSGEMFIEISNNVFMSHRKELEGTYSKMEGHNVDFGSGFERVAMIYEFRKKDGSIPRNISTYDTDLFIDAKTKLQKYLTDATKGIRSQRIILDHLRAVIFLISDDVLPSNKDQGYLLRRLIRRILRNIYTLSVDIGSIYEIVEIYINRYKEEYTYLEYKKEDILKILEEEISKFDKALQKGLRNLSEIIPNRNNVTGTQIFELYETYGFPFEMTLEELSIPFDSEQCKKLENEFKKEMKKHKEKSQQKSNVRFKGGLAENSQITTALHTLQHLLLRSLKEVVNKDIKQCGSNITKERISFDFNYNKALTEIEIKEIEDLVNKKINENLNIIKVEIPKKEAEEIGAEMEFGQKYPEVVSVYFVTDEDTTQIPSSWFSAEFCGGPHVKSTGDINGVFKIYKQESVGSGRRRVKAKLITKPQKQSRPLSN